MKTILLITVLLAGKQLMAQPGKQKSPGSPVQVSPGNVNKQVEKNKMDSLNERRSKNEVSIESLERKNRNTGRAVKLDDLKNPFDTGKVKSPASNRKNLQPGKPN